ncbi:MAG TPA: VOC family protein [Chitinophagaceae bacterium]|nr:VOC family protein [Chitinophagaceae bacterium]
MKMIPLFRCRNMKDAISFYTTILDFELKDADASPEDWVVSLKNGEAELLLTSLEGDQKIGIAANVQVEQIDELFAKYLGRGLDISHKQGSPVHQGPIDQSWGNREFYVTDADGNTLRFFKPLY